MPQALKIYGCGQTDVGLVRQSNEDSFGLFPGLHLYMVADGMGGHAAGEVASRIAVESVRKYLAEQQDGAADARTRLVHALEGANHAIHEAGEYDPGLNGMGTTAVAVHAVEDAVCIAYVGDSRVYLYHENQLEQITQDHSLVNEYVRQGLLTREAAAHHPMRHVISRALGANAQVEVEVIQRVPTRGDTLLLCSDGLSNKVPLAEMQAIFAAPRERLEQYADALIQKAKDQGGEDNITVVLVRYQ